MSGVKGRSGGARPGSGPKPGAHRDRSNGNGRQPGALDKSLSPARIIPRAEKWNFAEYSLAHAYSMIDILVHIAKTGTNEGVRVMAADKVLDRAVGKAPATIDISAKRHQDIEYRSAEDRAKIRAAIEAEGVPRALLDLQVDPIEEDEDD